MSSPRPDASSLTMNVAFLGEWFVFILSFIHSFIQTFSIEPLQVHYYSKAPQHCTNTVRSFTPKRQMQLRVKDLSKVSTWRLDRDSNPRPSGRKASTPPMRNHAECR